jgi:CRP/FNR family transcriptional regulator
MVSTFLGFAANLTSHGSPYRSRRRLRSGRLIVLATPQSERARIRNVLFAEGDPADEVFEVLKGAVVVSRSLTGGRRQILDVVGPGRMVGFTARPAHECSAIALTATQLIAFDRFSAQNWKDEDLDFNAAVLTEIDRLRRLASLLGRKTAIERLATFLVDLLGDGEGSQVVRLLLSRQEIADHLGLAVETVSRSFFALKQRGIIERARRTSVTVLDCSALRGIGAGDGETIA